MDMEIESLTSFELHDLCQDEKRIIEFLQEKGLLKKQMTCPNCGQAMRICGKNWRCCRRIQFKGRSKRCDKKVSLKKNSWFDKTKLGYGEVLKLTYMLVHNLEQKYIAHELRISINTVSQWNVFLRQVLVDWLHTQSEPLGGMRKIVEVVESKFGRKKYNKGHAVEGQWVFGGVEHGSKKMFLIPVKDRSSKTLNGIIKEWILPGTTIISDCLKGYHDLDKKHFTINHSVTFVNRLTGAHAIESLWRHTRSFLPTYSRNKKNFIGCLAYYCFHSTAKLQKKDLFNLVLHEISKISFDSNVGNLDEGKSDDETDSENESDNEDKANKK